MKVLLDTHALLWWLSDSDRLGENAREIIADPYVFASASS
ncbi:twitching motility protein PilT [Komagataeibacter rhaeticus]|nr:twitching motility protein PilT [Komagataeibacter rhaeticus]